MQVRIFHRHFNNTKPCEARNNRWHNARISPAAYHNISVAKAHKSKGIT